MRIGFLTLLTILFILDCGSNNAENNANIKSEKMGKILDHNKPNKAPELRVEQWIDGNGKRTTPIRIKDLGGKFKIIYCYQHWCPGCHSHGLPSLKKLVEKFNGNNEVAFMAVQTVFEGERTNTYERIRETQLKYDLKIPFGHDPGNGRSTVMEDYQTGGTPWFIFIDQDDNIVFSDFHINVEETINFIEESIIKKNHK